MASLELYPIKKELLLVASNFCHLSIRKSKTSSINTINDKARLHKLLYMAIVQLSLAGNGEVGKGDVDAAAHNVS